MSTYLNNLSSLYTDGLIESTYQGRLLGSKSTMPTAGATYGGCTILYEGQTTAEYTQNRFYRCEQVNGTWAWVQIEVAEEADLSDYVQKSTKVAGHPLSSDVVITPDDIGAVPDTRTVNGQTLDADVDITLASLGGVPDTRTINSKPLSADVVLDSGDIGAIDESYLSVAKPVSTSTDTEVPTSKAVYTAVKEVADSVSAEAVTRSSADNSLQSQIDALIAKSDVVDIVGTKAELDAYDTTKLGDNDIIKVLSDSSHNDMTTYYRWIITSGVGAWDYIGGEGPYLTTANASATYVPKTTTVNSKPLSTNITLDASDVSAIPSSYLSTTPPSASSLDTQVPTSKAVYMEVDAVATSKQDKLTFDSAPTSGSSNPVTSGGILTALTDGTVSKVGTATKGSASLPIYLNAGVPTAITMGSVASGNNAPVTGGAVHTACTNGTVTKVGTATKGSATVPIYLNAGVPTAITLGSVASGNNGLVTGGAVFTAINNADNGSLLKPSNNVTTTKNIAVSIVTTASKNVTEWVLGGVCAGQENIVYSNDVLYIENQIGLKFVQSSVPYHRHENSGAGGEFVPMSEEGYDTKTMYYSTATTVADALINQTILVANYNTAQKACLMNGQFKGVFVTLSATGNIVRVPTISSKVSDSDNYSWVSGFTTYYEMRITGSTTGNLVNYVWNQAQQRWIPQNTPCTLFSDTASGSFNIPVLNGK